MSIDRIKIRAEDITECAVEHQYMAINQDSFPLHKYYRNTHQSNYYRQHSIRPTFSWILFPKMVKFSKQFEGQLVPEWKEAFVDYWQLKKAVKKIQTLDNQNRNSKKQTSPFAHSIISSLRKYTFIDTKKREPRVIQVLSASLISLIVSRVDKF